MTKKTESEIISENLVRAFVQFRRLRLENPPGDRHCFHTGMKRSEIMLLMALADAKNGSTTGVSVSELSRKLHVKSPSITPILAGLETKQMVRRTIDPEDRRIVRVNLLDAGRATIHKMWLRIVEKTTGLVNYLGEKKSRQLTDLINESFAYIIASSRQASQPKPEATEETHAENLP